MKKSILQNIPVGLILVCLTASAAFAQQTTAFSYEGKLTDAGSPANANYDLQFKLFDTVTVGTGAQQGATLVRNPVAVSAGLFTVQLDFGANVFNGADRYLEIGVRPTGDPDPYSVLAPRQPITASPYAIQTLNAQQLGGLPASGFVQNTTAQQAGANFNIGGIGTAGNLNVNSAISVAGSAPRSGAGWTGTPLFRRRNQQSESLRERRTLCESGGS
jgi:phage-related tail protein